MGKLYQQHASLSWLLASIDGVKTGEEEHTTARTVQDADCNNFCLLGHPNRTTYDEAAHVCAMTLAVGCGGRVVDQVKPAELARHASSKLGWPKPSMSRIIWQPG